MSRPGGGCSALALRQLSTGSPPLRRPATFLNSSCVARSSRSRDCQQPVGVERDALVEPQLAVRTAAAEPEGAAGPGRQVRFQIFDVALDGLRRLGGRVGQVAQQVEVVEGGKRLRQIRFDELERAAERLQADLHEDARADP